MKSKKRQQTLLGIFLLLAVGAILFMTLQPPEQTLRMSDPVREWLARKGIDLTGHQVRSNAHIIEYFVMGVLACAFCRATENDIRFGLAAGLAFGTADECLRIVLPTREFDVFDLLRDYLGVAAGAVAVLLVSYLYRRLFSQKEKGEDNNREPRS